MAGRMAICFVPCVLLGNESLNPETLFLTIQTSLPPPLSSPATLMSWLLLKHARQALPYVLFSPPEIFVCSYLPIWLPYLFILKDCFLLHKTILTTLFITITLPATLYIAFLLYFSTTLLILTAFIVCLSPLEC